jgi:glycosyltransferase involved in cell wall biosynthesis
MSETASTSGLTGWASSRGDSEDVVVARVEATLGRLHELAALVDQEPRYDVPELDYEVPADFLLSVVIPVYDERATVRKILARLTAVPIPMEVVIVDDYSTDGTRDLLRPLEMAERVHVIYKPSNEGKGAALRTGFSAARGTVIMVQDADLEYDPRDIPALLRPLVEQTADVVYGSRFLRDTRRNSSSIHRLGNRWLTRASNLTTGLRLTDMETCYKAFRREVLRDITIEQDRFGFEPEITAKLARRNCRFQEVPIRYHSRGWDEGKKIGWRDGLNALYCIARYGWQD